MPTKKKRQSPRVYYSRVCKRCGRLKRHHGRNLCQSCHRYYTRKKIIHRAGAAERVVLPWSPNELALLRETRADGMTLSDALPLFPGRSLSSLRYAAWYHDLPSTGAVSADRLERMVKNRTAGMPDDRRGPKLLKLNKFPDSG